MFGVYCYLLFMWVEKLFFVVGYVEYVVGDGDEIFVVQVYFLVGDLQDLWLVVVVVDYQQFVKIGLIERFGDFQQGMQQCIVVKGQGVGKMQMFFGFIVDDWWNGVGWDCCWQSGEGMVCYVGRYYVVY